MTLKPTGRVGLYVHVPFCLSHCPYCDFAVTVTRRIPHADYLDAVLRELRSRAAELRGRRLSTIYFGGGTPSLWDGQAIARVIAEARSIGDDVQIEEITVEVNPGKLDPTWIETVVAAGVDRISLGAQSVDPDTLRALGRSHRPDDVVTAIELARAAGISRVSVDLIYGAPGATVESARSDAEAFVSLDGVEHISAYELTWETGTAFDRRRRLGIVAAPDDDTLVEIADAVTATLRGAAFERYEVSNHARAGGRSRHNSAYWEGHEYVGVGVGAHSLHIDEQGSTALRRQNVRALRRYLADPLTADEIERLDAATHLAECVMVGVRTARGIDLDQLRTRFGAVVATLEELVFGWEARGLGARSGAVFVASESGLRHADTLGREAIERLVVPRA